MTVKDSFQTEGCITTSGAPELADFVPSEDADPVVQAIHSRDGSIRRHHLTVRPTNLEDVFLHATGTELGYGA